MRALVRPATFAALLVFLFVAAVCLPGCTDSNEAGQEKLDTPRTVFDPTEPDLRDDDQKVVDFVLNLERKYKREEIRNAIDLHFSVSGPRRVKVRLTYDRTADPTTVSSIADSAIELAKRLKREDPSVRDIDLGFDRETVRRGN
ncbi:MAG: hypothetical protein JST04_04895 [Bdellovibrionales bacterium]|nr:hypothetical protein [Bdellovibrionales bacterium]